MRALIGGQPVAIVSATATRIVGQVPPNTALRGDGAPNCRVCGECAECADCLDDCGATGLGAHCVYP